MESKDIYQIGLAGFLAMGSISMTIKYFLKQLSSQLEKSKLQKYQDYTISELLELENVIKHNSKISASVSGVAYSPNPLVSGLNPQIELIALVNTYRD
jgi:hypothetical protein